jgi:hypothetical protein
MSSTTNIQNLLVNVFRPSYQYRTLPTPNYFVQLELSNVEAVYANVIDTQNLRVSDANSNVYVGREAGNAYSELRDCFSNTTLGYAAGLAVSNTSNGTYLGAYAGANASNASNVIAIGTFASGRGTKNIYIGNGTGGGDTDASNIYIGNNITVSGVNNRLLIGSGLDPSGTIIGADMLNRRVGILIENPVTYPVEIADYTFISNGLGINCDPRDHTLNVNGDCAMEDGFGLFTFDRDQATSNSTMTFWSYTPGKSGLVQFGQQVSSNPVYMGINTPGVDGGYTLDVSGTVRVNDLSGNFVTMENNRVTSVGGFASIVGITADLSAGVTSNVGSWRPGINKVVVLGSVAGQRHGGDWIYDGTTAYNISSNSSTTLITTAGSDITISNSTGGNSTFRYNITYFPTL